MKQDSIEQLIYEETEKRLEEMQSDSYEFPIPLLLPNQYKIVYIKDFQNVSSCDEITVTEHLEEYIYDES